MTSETADAAPTGVLQYDLSPRTKAVVIAGTMLGLFVSAINQTVVSTALPRIIAELGREREYLGDPYVVAWELAGGASGSPTPPPL